MAVVTVGSFRLAIPDDFAVAHEGSRLVCTREDDDVVLQVSYARIDGDAGTPAFEAARKKLESNLLVAMENSAADPEFVRQSSTAKELAPGLTFYKMELLTPGENERFVLFGLMLPAERVFATLEASASNPSIFDEVERNLVAAANVPR